MQLMIHIPCQQHQYISIFISLPGANAPLVFVFTYQRFWHGKMQSMIGGLEGFHLLSNDKDYHRCPLLLFTGYSRQV